jgi:polycystin 2
MACEGVYILFILYYLVEETLEILKIRGAYFKSVYNNLDIVVVILSIGNQGLSIYTFFVVENQVTFFNKIFLLLKGEQRWTRFIHL